MDDVNLLFADVLPERISACETYSYFVSLGLNPETRGQDIPSGVINIEVPYDGYRCFSMETAARLRERVGKNLDRPALGQIGRLAVSMPPDWEHDWDRPAGLNQYAIQIPLRDAQMTSPDLWTADTLRAMIEKTYKPEAPTIMPRSREMQVYDNVRDALETTQASRKLQEISQKAGNISEVLELLDGEPLQGGQMVVALAVTVFLPDFLASEQVKVTIQALKFGWPTIAPDWLMRVEAPDGPGELGFRYNPDDQSVEVPDVQALRGEPQAGSQLVPYSCLLRLTLNYPGQVIRQDELNGSARIKIEGCLLSGRLVGWLDVYGERNDEFARRIELLTLINVGFTAILSERFKHRRRAVYRQWYLRGVRLSPVRMDDIAAALRDMGYKAGQPELKTVVLKQQDVDHQVQIGVVTARRLSISDSQDPADLQLEVWALPVSLANTQRRHTLAEGGEVSTTWETSDLALQVRGQVNGPGSLLALDVDALMDQLKSRFNAVADLR